MPLARSPGTGRQHLTLSGFCQGGAADTMAPGALLATVVEAVTGPDGAGLLTELLREQVGVPPAPETTALYRRLTTTS